MTAIEQAIKEAKTQGYDPVGRYHPDIRNFACPMDKDFWQALGKAREWPTNICRECGEPNGCKWGKPNFIVGWEYFWHVFIHHLAEGKDAESFFAELV